MKEIHQYHSAAMEKADLAFIQRFHGNEGEAVQLFTEALEYERKAALLAMQSQLGEPSTSVLFRSAAAIAYNAGKYRDAERLASLGLAGETPDDIAEELRNLLEDINFHRHLNLQGVSLGPAEVQMVIAGHGVAYGMASADQVITRLSNFEHLTQRTVERKLGRPFRESGAFPVELSQRFQPYIAQPRPGSLAFTIKLGQPTTQIDAFEDAQSAQDVLDDIVENISLINAGKEAEVKSNIPDEAYYRNFIARTKALAPDGEDISLVGFTLIRKGEEKQYPLQRTKKQISQIHLKENKEFAISADSVVSENISISGRLFIANAQKGFISLDAGKKKVWKVIVPKGLSDIVKSYFEEQVTIHGLKIKDNTIEMIDVDEI